MAKNIGYTPGTGAGKATKKMAAAGKKSQNPVTIRTVSNVNGKRVVGTKARMIQAGPGNTASTKMPKRKAK